MQTPSPASPIRFYSFPYSGHCHRVALMLALLELPHETVPVDLTRKANKSPAFLALNAFGQVPVIEDGDTVIADSLAILTYLASRYGNGQWQPQDAVEAAGIQRWFSQAAGALAFGVAAARAGKRFGAVIDMKAAQTHAHTLLTVMNAVLARQDYLVGSQLTLADIAHYAYVARAPEGDISLESYPHISAWLKRIESLPHFVPMPALPKV